MSFMLRYEEKEVRFYQTSMLGRGWKGDYPFQPLPNIDPRHMTNSWTSLGKEIVAFNESLIFIIPC